MLLFVIFISKLIFVEAVGPTRCVMTIPHKGNYPLWTPLDEPNITDHLKWTTVTTGNLGGLANEWKTPNRDGSYEAEFTIKPPGPGFENRTVIHIASDLTNPFNVYTSQTINNFIAHSREVTENPPFNCFINRNINTQSDLLKEYLEDCPPDDKPFECIQRVGLFENFQCAAGTTSPICCYTKYFLGEDQEPTAEDLLYMEAVHHNTIQDIKKCLPTRKEMNIKDVEKQCPNNIKDEYKKALYYMFNKNASCNPFFAGSVDGCTVEKRTGQYYLPCFGTCLTALMVNVEIPATSSYEEKADTVVSIVQREVEFSQKYSSKFRKTSELFGYRNSDTEESKGYFRVIRKRAGNLPFIAGQWNSIWMKVIVSFEP